MNGEDTMTSRRELAGTWCARLLRTSIWSAKRCVLTLATIGLLVDAATSQLKISAPSNQVIAGQSVQLVVTSPGGADVTSAPETIYLTSNETVGNVSGTGLVSTYVPGRLTVSVANVDFGSPTLAAQSGEIELLVGLPGDADYDGLPDAYETTFGLNPLSGVDAATDLDGDGLLNFEEHTLGTNPATADSDGDGHTDGLEVFDGTNPLSPDPFVVLDDKWVLMLNGQVVQPNADGVFSLRNIALADTSPTDFWSDTCFRVTGVRLVDGLPTEYLWSPPFRLRDDLTTLLTDFTVSNAPGYFSPESIAASLADTDGVISVLQSTSMVVSGRYVRPSGPPIVTILDPSPLYPVCVGDFGTPPTMRFVSSNPAIASIDDLGIVRGHSPGRAHLTVEFEGNLAITEVRVAPPGDPLTTIRGFVQLEDGTPVSGATIKVTQGANTLTTLSQSIGGQLGRFEIPGALSIAQPIQQGQAAKIQALVEVTVAGQPLRGISPLVDATPGGVTDMGVIVASAGGGGFRDYALTVPRNWVGSTALSLQINSRDYSVVQVRAPGIGFQQQIVTQPNGLYEVQLPLSLELTGSEIVESKGITVSATKDVHVSLVNRRPTTSEVFTALPTASLGFSYRVMSHRPADGSSTFAVLAIEDNTQVQITTTAATPNHPAGAMFLVDLNAYDAYQVQSSLGDLTGSIVTASKPIAVFGANRCARVPDTQDFCDYLVEQLPPTPAWGTQFSAVPLSGRLNGDTWRFLASELDTTITIDGPGAAQQQLHLTNAGDFVQLNLPGFQTISSNKPILAAQFANGTAFDNQPGDPMMMLVAANTQWLSSYVFSTPTAGFNTHYVNIVAPVAIAQAGQVLLDGVSVPSGAFTTLPGGQFAAARRTLTAGKHRLSSLNSTAPLGAQVYGFAGAPNHEGYGFPAALSLPIGH